MNDAPYSGEDLAAVSDNPEWTDAEIATARPFADVLPGAAEAIKRARGRPRAVDPLEAVTLRVHPATLARYKAAGADWRARMAAAIEHADV